jgi:hypothetical protein
VGALDVGANGNGKLENMMEKALEPADDLSKWELQV